MARVVRITYLEQRYPKLMRAEKGEKSCLFHDSLDIATTFTTEVFQETLKFSAAPEIVTLKQFSIQ